VAKIITIRLLEFLGEFVNQPVFLTEQQQDLSIGPK
jgi:hypothetical protein